MDIMYHGMSQDWREFWVGFLFKRKEGVIFDDYIRYTEVYFNPIPTVTFSFVIVHEFRRYVEPKTKECKGEADNGV